MSELCACGHVRDLHARRFYDCMGADEDSLSGLCECLQFRSVDEVTP